MIASDLDGTLLGPDHRLTARTVAAVRAADAAGIRVVAATGRSSLSAVQRLRPAGTIVDAVCSNGSLVHDVVADRTTHRFPIDADHVARLLAMLDALDDGFSCCWETDHGNGWDDDFADIAFLHEDLGATPGLLHRPNGAHRTTKVMVHHPDLTEQALRDHLTPLLADPLTVSCSGVRFVEITAVGVDKSTGLRHLCERWSIAAEEVVAFGDNHNDVAMLTWAGRGVAVANAAPSAVAAADEVIGHHADDAVAAYIETLLDER